MSRRKPETIKIRPEKGGKRVPMTFLPIQSTGPEGFWMGSLDWEESQPVHQIWLSEFWMSETPVTQAQYRALMPEHKNDFEGKGEDLPAENMTWDAAVEYCRKLTAQLPRHLLKTGWTAQLPTEAQWEYACRAGTGTEYYSGNGTGALDGVGWYGEEWGEGSTHPVKAKAERHPWGLHSMHGNVWERCADAWHERAYSQPGRGVVDPVQREHEDSKHPRRVLRGGSWLYPAGWCRSAFRLGDLPGDAIWGLGFRVVLVSGPARHPA
jgi:formylglycine-generating enzyme required for sulfatase activity